MSHKNKEPEFKFTSWDDVSQGFWEDDWPSVYKTVAVPLCSGCRHRKGAACALTGKRIPDKYLFDHDYSCPNIEWDSSRFDYELARKKYESIYGKTQDATKNTEEK